MKKPVASLSLDLDDRWAFLKTHGDSSWVDYPSYFPAAIPRFLDQLDSLNQKITVFVVGKDATFDRNHELFMRIHSSGHEIGNHTFHHDPWLQYYEDAEINEELALAEEAISSSTGASIEGFRGPAFTFSPTLLNVLNRRNYNYDASTLPNILNPLSRAYFFMNSKLTKEDMKKRGLVFGNWKDGLRPIRAYRWNLGHNKTLVEIPVTTFPFLRFPIHLTYILHLSTYSRSLALRYFSFAVRLCRLNRIDLSVLLSPTDFLGKEDLHGIPFFPAMNLARNYKLEIVEGVIRTMQKHFKVLPIGEHAKIVSQRKELNLIKPIR